MVGSILVRDLCPALIMGAAMLSMEARLLGFVIGIVLMVVIPTLAGSPARFF